MNSNFYQVSASLPSCSGPCYLFRLGNVVATPGALELLGRTGTDAAAVLARHQRGDFGTVDAEDVQSNKNAILNGGRILSAYVLGGERLWIITDADRALPQRCYFRRSTEPSGCGSMDHQRTAPAAIASTARTAARVGCPISPDTTWR